MQVFLGDTDTAGAIGLGWMGARGKAGTVFTKNVPAFPRQTRPAPTFQTSTESLLPAIPARRPACEETKKGRDVPPLSGLQSLPPSGDGRDLTTKKTFYGATGLRPSSAGALTFTPWLMLRLSPAGTSTFQNRL